MEKIVAYIKEKIKSKYSESLTIKNDFKGIEKGIMIKKMIVISLSQIEKI